MHGFYRVGPALPAEHAHIPMDEAQMTSTVSR